LCEKSEEVHVKEGPNLNKAVTTLSRVVEQLSAPPDLAVQSDFGNSKLTQLCLDILGGNCKTRVLAIFRAHQSLALPHTLAFAKGVTKIVNYPVFGDLAARGLEKRYRRLVQRASVMSSSPVVEGVDAEVMRLNDLEGQVVHGNLELIKLKDENDRLTNSLAEARAQSTSLMNEKTGLSVSVLNSEEERLKSAKALIDLKIENARIREDAEAKSFEQTNQQLLVEHDLVETRTRYDALEATTAEAKTALEEAQQDHKDLLEEYETLKSNHIKTNKSLDNERRRVEELGLEVLSLSNARVAVLDGAHGQLDLKASQDKARLMNKEIADKIASLVQKNEGLRVENESLRRKMMNSTSTSKTDLSALKSLHDTQAGALQGQLHAVKEGHFQATMSSRKYMRAIEEAKAELEAVRRRMESLEIDNDRLLREQQRLVANYRGKLVKYAKDVANLSVGAGAAEQDQSKLRKYVDVIMKDMVTTYTFREQELEANLDRLRKERQALALRYDQLANVYKSLREIYKKTGNELPDTLDMNANALVPSSQDTTPPGRGISAPVAFGDARRLQLQNKETPHRSVPTMDWVAVRKMVTDYQQTTQRKLETERSQLLVRCTGAEEKAKRLEEYISNNLLPYQKEIIRLRHQLAEK